ncbi:MAG: RelA/SpoT domain-containing protein [Candidatus Nomurabacteria bacterium]|jgi:ppGpp synthetase/RelA/SpoT-type nucleotidyltranferase|nr:RelA/SpoT domain-containing protein [Candidatus Nomurabacteria bacterium]
MKYPVPSNLSNEALNRLGDILRNGKNDDEPYLEALQNVNIWRKSHWYPMNTFQSTLRRKVKELFGAASVDDRPIVAQRLKRMPAIIDKLRRKQTNDMSLSRMQDVGGLRAILDNCDDVYKLRDYYTCGNFSSYNLREKNYIRTPKEDGYRGIHLIFKYNNIHSRNNGEASKYRGLFIEIQIRTRLQHIWATAVETVGTMNGEKLKSDLGSAEWLDFFCTMSKIFAVVEHQQTPTADMDYDLKNLVNNIKKIKRLNKKLNILDNLRGWKKATENISGSGGFYNLIILNLESHTVEVRKYEEKEIEIANEDYAKAEASDANTNQVLVSSVKIKNLRSAYPNYFLDIDRFIEFVDDLVNKIDERRATLL